MDVFCSWCEAVLRRSPNGSTAPSHALCETCAAQLHEALARNGIRARR